MANCYDCIERKDCLLIKTGEVLPDDEDKETSCPEFNSIPVEIENDGVEVEGDELDEVE